MNFINCHSFYSIRRWPYAGLRRKSGFAFRERLGWTSHSQVPQPTCYLTRGGLAGDVRGKQSIPVKPIREPGGAAVADILDKISSRKRCLAKV